MSKSVDKTTLPAGTRIVHAGRVFEVAESGFPFVTKEEVPTNLTWDEIVEKTWTPEGTFMCAVLLAPEHVRARLAKEFEVAVATVDRWALGTARPHPRIQAMVVTFLKGLGIEPRKQK